MAEEKIGCITVRDVPAAKFIAAYAEELKKNDKFVLPKWADLVKTGVSKELAPYDPDWYFIRAGIFLFEKLFDGLFYLVLLLTLALSSFFKMLSLLLF